ncbi:Crp/Fnr family transcriptional regulator [Paenibacillus sp. 598K]|uniref:Crp/Fnr family transcriptional regulator n=1 Tax=Paenibacillus sp. 598K TaxID=1117987 RepID=UPI000FF9D527|nr:Crp/Fnr family transcriptional regulator [Paenibacillus sp. 598K]GBF71882.1 Crp/Fnr family transcriptional regulator [Paenibacillus sp. 598K]
MDRIHNLSSFNLMRLLSEEDLITMDALTTITTYPKAVFIQTPDTFVEELFFIKRGKVRLYQLNGDGKQLTLDILSEGNIFGELGSISMGTRELFIETLEESDLCVMDKARFDRYLLDHPQFMLNMLQTMSERLSDMSLRIQSLSLGSLHQKVMAALLKLAERFGTEDDEDGYATIKLSISQQEIAHLVGVSREAVALTLKELVACGQLRTGFRTVALHRSLVERQ